MTHWTRISETEYRLDHVWTVRADSDGWWFAWRGKHSSSSQWLDLNDAMLEAERLREEDKLYA